MRNKIWLKAKGVLALTLAGLMLVSSAAPVAAEPTTVYAADRRAEIEKSLYNAEYYAKANEDVAVALNGDPTALYNHWLNYGKAEGRNASMVFNAKYYLEVNPDVANAVGAENYTGAYEHFVTSGLLEGRESSPVFSVKYYLQANTDVANAFNNDYVMAAQHFNESAIAEGRSGSGNFDYTVYRACNTDVAELYDDYVQGYYIHYINHGRAEGRTGGLGANNSGTTGGGSTGGSTAGIDTTAASWRIFDAAYYLERYPELATTVGTDEKALYQYWLNTGIALGQTASPVIVPEEYLELNADVAEVFGDDEAAALNHFLTAGILEGRTGSYEFDYSIYASCNTDVGGVFEDDIVGYYFHYVKYGKAEKRTAAVYIPPSKDDVVATKTIEDTEGRKYVLGFNAYGDMIEQKVYDADGTLLSTNTITNGIRNIRIAFKNSDGSTRANRMARWNTNGTMTQITEYNRTENTYHFAEPAMDEDGNEYYHFGSVEPQKQIIYYYRNGELNYYTVRDYSLNVNKLTRYNAAGGVEYYTLYVEYDEDGNVLKSEKHNEDGTLISYTLYSGYNADGYESEASTYDAEGNLLYQDLYEYDENSNMLKQVYVDYEDESASFQLEYEYYENGQCSKEVYSSGTYQDVFYYYQNGTTKKEEYYYDGILNDYTVYDEASVMVEKGSWSYNIYDEEADDYVDVFSKCFYDQDVMIREETYDSNMTLFETVEDRFEYDVTGERIVKESVYRNDVLVSYVVYTYDETTLNPLKDYFYDAEGNLLEYTVYEINDNTIKQSQYDADDVLQEYTIITIHENGETKTVEVYMDGELCVYEEYDENGAIIAELYYSDGDIYSGYATEYDENGCRSKYSNYRNGVLREVVMYYSNEFRQWNATYTNDGVISKEKDFYWNGIMKSATNYYYSFTTDELVAYDVTLCDEKGIITSQKIYNPDGSEMQ